MSKNNPSRFNSLAWVKHEIDHTLASARESIQTFASHPDETQHLVLANSHLRDVHGALEVADLSGAAMLTKETIEVVRELGEGNLPNTDEACQQVLRALIQLPDYLDYIQAGQADSPIVLVSAVNDLRALRKAALLTDEVAEIPGLEKDAIVLEQQERSEEDLQKLAELTRLVFELGLLGWYQQKEPKKSLAKMAVVTHRLRLASKHNSSRRLWWIAGAVIEALKNDLLDTSAALKQQVGRVDREIKRLFNAGEEAFADSIPDDLVKGLLHYVAAASTGHPQVDEVRRTYFSDTELPSDEQREASRNSLSGQNAELNRSVAKSLTTNLDNLKFELAEFQQGGFQSPGALSRFLPGLAELAETLDVVGLDKQKRQAISVRQRLEEGLAEARNPTNSELQYFAHMLVDIEDAIDGLANPGIVQVSESADPESRARVSDQKYVEVRNVVIQEVLREIERCKDGIQRYAADLEELNPLRQTLGRFTQVAGSMHLLSLDNAGDLVNDIRNAIELIIEGDIVLDIDSLDNLAESIAAVEVYLEVLDTSNVAQDSYIEIGQAALKSMRRPTETGSIPVDSHYQQMSGAPDFIDETPTALIDSLSPDTLGAESLQNEDLASAQQEFSGSLPEDEGVGVDLSEEFGAEVFLPKELDVAESQASAEMQEFAESIMAEQPQEIDLADLQLDEESTPAEKPESSSVFESETQQSEVIDTGIGIPESPDDSFIEAVSDLENQMEQELTAMQSVEDFEAGLESPETGTGAISEFSDDILQPLKSAEDETGEEAVDPETGTGQIFPDIRFGEEDTQELEEPTVSTDTGIIHAEIKPEDMLAESGAIPTPTISEDPSSDSIELPEDQQSLLDDAALFEFDVDPNEDEEPLDFLSMTEAEIEGWEPQDLDEKNATGWVSEGNTVPALTDIDAASMAAVDALPLEDILADTGTGTGEQIESIELPAALTEKPAAKNKLDDLEMFAYQARALYGLKMLAHQPDEEVYSIFHEELTEETAHLRVSFGQWLEDSSDQDALTTARRAFHTIKGSGRLIGAQVVGEYAWLHEKILNGILDQQVKVNTEITDCIAAGIEILPKLQKQLERRELPSKKVHKQVDWAERVGNGQFEAPVPIEQKAVSSEAVNPTTRVDTELLEIFNTDSRLHLDALERSVVLCRTAFVPKTFDSEGLIAVHTLNGAARTARISEIHHPAAAAEHYLRKLTEAGLPPDEGGLVQLDELHGHIGGVLDALDQQSVRKNGDALAQRFDALTASVALRKQDDEPETLTGTGTGRGNGFDALTGTDNGFEALSETDTGTGTGTGIGLDALTSAGIAAAAAASAALLGKKPVDESTESQVLPGVEEIELEPVSETAVSMPVLITEEEAARTETRVSTLEEQEQQAELSELVGVFVEECNEILESCDDAMARWQADADDTAAVGEIKRELHTLKGSARMAGVEEVGSTSHSMENLLLGIEASGHPASRNQFTALNAAFDHISESARALEAGTELPDNTGIIALLDKVQSGKELDADDLRLIVSPDEPATRLQQAVSTHIVKPEAESTEPVVEAAEQTPAESVEPVVVEEDVAEETAAVAPTRLLEGELDLPLSEVTKSESHESQIQEAIRIQADLLDRMVDNIGEVNVCHARVEQQVGSLNFNLTELDQTIRRVTEQLRRLEMEAEAQILHRYKDSDISPDDTNASAHFDPLELDRYSTLQQLSRSLAESTSDLSSIHQLLIDEVGGLDNVLQQQGRVSNELQQGLMRTRMSKFKVMVPRLRRVVRRTALELGKEVNLTVSGDDNEMDRKMLESIVVPLEHLLRNAVVHGIESPDSRIEAGKAREGDITVSFSREGPEVIIEVSDDGVGIDSQRVKRQAISQQLVAPQDELTQGEIHALILQPGFSTAESLSEDAGRGVGMDVVNTQLKQLNGVLDIRSDAGKGCSFRLSLPFTLAINQALLLEAGENVYAIPMGTIDGVMQAKGRTLIEKFDTDAPSIGYGGEEYELAQLVPAMNHTAPQPLQDSVVYPVLFAHLGDSRVGFIAGRILGNREIVVKPMGALLQGVEGISGATILGDGRVVMILDMAGLIRVSQKALPPIDNPETEAIVLERQTVLVVDDSITIRKVTSKMLERHNYNVVTAKDGMDAVAQLQDVRPDIILLDIEMPRMDGFEFAAHVRNSEDWKGMPIIMISSRTGKKHRERAAGLGVNHFLGKPYQDDELLGEIQTLLKTGS